MARNALRDGVRGKMLDADQNENLTMPVTALINQHLKSTKPMNSSDEQKCERIVVVVDCQYDHQRNMLTRCSITAAVPLPNRGLCRR